jgi:hypothetical protein
MARPPRESFECPNCGAQVPGGARSCPECGSDDETGWSEDTMYDGLDLPDPGYGEEAPARPRSRIPWALIGVVLAVLALVGWLMTLF